ncbi:hypothetical protein J3Q64DRAFT_1700766 [Phycomyces blakesleeanus]|uniref:Uncharacterized protein n=1 Tax=Phycomyces blakesleeanus TaxID=4837 RepID=A0ABR3ASY6_PHYBL
MDSPSLMMLKSKLVLSKWDKFYGELLPLRDVRQKSRTEGQKLINKSMTNASNLCSNLSILNKLERKFNFQAKSILAVDFVGKYFLEKKEGVAVAILVEELVIPIKKSDLEHASTTINVLFVLKNYALKLAEEVAAQPTRSKLRCIVRYKEPITALYQAPQIRSSEFLQHKTV